MKTNNKLNNEEIQDCKCDDKITATLREDLISQAVHFLMSDIAEKSSKERKILFLSKKGLTEEEINLSFERYDRLRDERDFIRTVNYDPNVQLTNSPFPSQLYQYPYTVSSFGRFIRFANGIFILGSFAHAVYWFYKNYALPYLYGKSTQTTLEMRLNEIDLALTSSINDLKLTVFNMQREIEKQNNKQAIVELKNEVMSLKKLLLSKKQFPAAPLSGYYPNVQASIPAWQIVESADLNNLKKQEISKSSPASEEKNEDGSSPEGSQSSDSSSLEVIKAPDSGDDDLLTAK